MGVTSHIKALAALEAEGFLLGQEKNLSFHCNIFRSILLFTIIYITYIGLLFYTSISHKNKKTI